MDTNSKYFEKLTATAAKMADWNNIPTKSLYFDQALKDEMERLFGNPVYEEHKAVHSIVPEIRRFERSSMDTAINILKMENERDAADAEDQNAALSFYSRPRSASMLLDVSEKLTSPFYSNMIYRPKFLAEVTDGSYSGILKKPQVFENKRTVMPFSLQNGSSYRSGNTNYGEPVNSSIDTQATINWKPKRKGHCSYCYKNGMPPSIFTSHNVRDEVGDVSCWFLKKRACPNCGACGRLLSRK